MEISPEKGVEKMKKLLAMLLTLVMVLGVTTMAWAEDTSVEAGTEKDLRQALCDAATDGSVTTIKLTANIELNMLYAAPNLPDSTVIQDNETGDTFNRYKTGIHPSEDDPTHWNKKVTDQTDEEKAVYGAYYHMAATDERIARLVVKAVQNYNQTVRKMPSALIAGLFNFNVMPKFEAAAGAEKAPDLDI